MSRASNPLGGPNNYPNRRTIGMEFDAHAIAVRPIASCFWGISSIESIEEPLVNGGLCHAMQSDRRAGSIAK
jgi:hypothetical protein